MFSYIKYLVLEEQRPFTFHDFSYFNVADNEYTMSHGTFRNKISKLIQDGKVIVDFCSNCTFYTLTGHRFAKNKSMTGNHTGVTAPLRKSNWIYETINNLPLDKNSLHDIRLSFQVPGTWSILSSNSIFKLNPRNKDIRLPGIYVDDLFIGVTVHRSDTVSVIVSCSYAPIAIDIAGIIRLSNSLTRVEERLAYYMEQSRLLLGLGAKEYPTIPNHMTWMVKMWHFGADGLKEYSGEKFHIAYTDAEGILTRIYSKQMKDGKVRLRPEIQQYPKKQLDEAIKEKLYANNPGSRPN